MARWHNDPNARTCFVTWALAIPVPILGEPGLARIVVEALAHQQDAGHYEVWGFVIMPEHVHVLIVAGTDTDVRRKLGDLKRWTARRIIAHLKGTRRADVLAQLACHARDGAQYGVWERGVRLLGIFSENAFMQKLAYIHGNPVRRGLAGQPTDYPYSSARNWLLDDHTLIALRPLVRP